MQGLPFDETEFPPPGAAVSSSWMDQSPRVPVVAPNPSPAATVTDEELYRLVGAPPPSPPAPSDEIIQRYSQQMPVAPSSQIPSYSQPQPLQYPQQQHQQHLSQQQRQQLSHQTLRHLPTQQLRPPQASSRVPATNASAIHHTSSAPQAVSHIPPNRRERAPTNQGSSHQLDSKRLTRPVSGVTMTVVPPDHRVANPGQTVRHPQAGPSSMAVSTSVAQSVPKDLSRKATRSAVEEARIRAQREAEYFASSRRDPTKREVGLTGASQVKASDVAAPEGPPDRRSHKRVRGDSNPNSANEGHSSRKKTKSPDRERERPKKEDDSETEKQERYKRRLDMNRESAAVSRVRRRAYVKELEERLAAVEAEKLQLEGKLEIMMSQNEGYKKQLEQLFLMVASGRRPTYPPQPQPPAPPPPPPGESS